MNLTPERKEQLVLEQFEGKKQKVWTCKIGWASSLPDGADFPMRRAIEYAYQQIAGQDPDFIFSGWGGELDEIEKQVVEGWNNKDVAS